MLKYYGGLRKLLSGKVGLIYSFIYFTLLYGALTKIKYMRNLLCQ